MQRIARTELTFVFAGHGDQLSLTYHRDGRPLAADPAQPFPSFGVTVPPVLSALGKLFQRGDWDALQAQLGGAGQVEVGHALASLLFPDATRVSDIMKAAVADKSETKLQPESRSIRARIIAADATLSALPWRLTRWGQSRLAESVAQWTFEVARDPDGGPVVQISWPPRILVIAPHAGDPPLPVDDHVAHLRQRLLGLSERYEGEPFWQVARSSEVIKACSRFRPDLVYYFGHGQPLAGRPCALLDDGPFPFDGLLALFDAPPRAVYLNGCWSAGAGWMQVGPALAPKVPLVLTQPTVTWTKRAGEQALDWMDHVVGRSVDPIEALHRTTLGAPSLVFEASMLAAHTHYRSWAPGPALGRRTTPVHTRLDRYKQRRPTVDEIERVMEQRRRLAAIVGHGTTENRPSGLQDLLREHVDKKLGQRARLHWLSVELPKDRPLRYLDFEAALRTALDVPYGVSWAEAWRLATQDKMLGRGLQVLVLRWGHHPLLEGDGALSAADLTCWLDFHRTLGADESFAGFDRARIVAFLTVVTEQGHGVQRLVEDFEAKHGVNGDVRFVALPALVPVPRAELIDHLRDETNAPKSLAPELADLLLSRSGSGTYVKLVPLIEAAEKDNWFTLQSECPANPSPYFT